MNSHARPAEIKLNKSGAAVQRAPPKPRVRAFRTQPPKTDSMLAQVSKYVLATYVYVLAKKLGDIDMIGHNIQNMSPPRSQLFGLAQSLRDEANGITRLLADFGRSLESGNLQGLEQARNPDEMYNATIRRLNGGQVGDSGEVRDGILPRLERIDELRNRIPTRMFELLNPDTECDNLESHLVRLDHRITHIAAFLEGAARSQKFEKVPLNQSGGPEGAKIESDA